MALGLFVAGATAAEEADLTARIAELEAQLTKMQEALVELRQQAADNAEAVRQSSAPQVRHDVTPLEPIALREEVVSRADLEAVRPMPEGTRFRYGGYVQLDGIASHYSDGSPPSLMDDLFVPGLIPVEPGDAPGRSVSRTNLHAKTSRFFFGTGTDTAAGRISSHVELDFLVSEQGDERVASSFAARIRHAFLTWEYAPGKSLMAGQNWSTFYNVQTLPDLLDFVGPTGTTFQRQPQVRWTNGGLQLALENVATRVRTGDGSTRLDDNELMPDFIARYDGETGRLDWSLAGVVRQLGYDARSEFGNDSAEDTRMGYGVSFGGVWQLERDDVRFMLTYGDALGRYLGIQAFDDGFVTRDGEVGTIDQWGAFAAYRHFWGREWRSTLALSAAGASNPGIDQLDWSEQLTRGYRSAHANLLYSPLPGLVLGGELIWGERELQNGLSGDMLRLQMALRYVF